MVGNFLELGPGFGEQRVFFGLRFLDLGSRLPFFRNLIKWNKSTHPWDYRKTVSVVRSRIGLGLIAAPSGTGGA